MTFQPSADSFGIRRLGFKCSWWHPRQANDVVASESSIFSENHNSKSFFRVAVNTYIPIFQSLDARGGRKLMNRHTHTHTHTHGTTTVTLDAHMHAECYLTLGAHHSEGYIVLGLCVCVFVCVSALICCFTHWNHKREIPTDSSQYGNDF